MSRRPGNAARRFVGGGSNPLGGIFHSKSKTNPLLSIVLVLLGTVLVIGCVFKGSGGSGDYKTFSKIEGDSSCTYDVHMAIPVLKKTYGDSMHKVLHVGPDTCSIVSQLTKEKDTEAWGVEPYDIEESDVACRSLVRKGLVRVADIKFPLPYRAKSFSLIIVSDSVDYLSPKYLNKTLPDLARVSAQNLVIFTGKPSSSKANNPHTSRFGRPAKMRSASWWARFFVQTSLEENETATKKFEQAAAKSSYKPKCQVFHLNSYH
ncbi:putative pectin methylesterase CGR2 [Bidens hawaiensis]|uniref:putative pectin methylesterase CGR2 n=1 Tax=Bidens hawaiensis TaxID=980011 RepID=UPI00404AB950